MTKKLILIIVLIIYGIFTFAENPKTDYNTYNKVVIKALAYGEDPDQEGQDWIRIVEEFQEKNRGIKIDYKLLYGETYHQTVIVRLAAGDIPHLAFMGADTRLGAPWKEAGQQFDHRPFIDTNYYDMDLIPDMGPNGEIYMIPMGTSEITTVLYMNEQLVRSLGFSAPGTYEDIVDMVPAARALGIDVITIDGADGRAWGSCLMSIIIARLSGDAHWVRKAVEGKYRFTDQEFIDSLAMLDQMIRDGVITDKSIDVDYGTNIAIFNNEEALFMIQDQWAFDRIDSDVANHTRMLPWPKFPGEKSNMAGSVAGAINVGYGITRAGAADPAIRRAAFQFLEYFYSLDETEKRLLDGAIVAPILKDFHFSDDPPNIIIQKLKFAQSESAVVTDVIDAFLSTEPNEVLNTGMQEIITGIATPEQIAIRVEELLWR